MVHLDTTLGYIWLYLNYTRGVKFFGVFGWNEGGLRRIVEGGSSGEWRVRAELGRRKPMSRKRDPFGRLRAGFGALNLWRSIRIISEGDEEWDGCPKTLVDK